MKENLRSEILKLGRKSYLLEEISRIRNRLISSGGYSERNIEKQEVLFNVAHVPEWERVIMRKSWDATKKLSHELFKELNELSDKILFETECDKNSNKPKQ